MLRKLSIVEDVFQITGRGTVVVPGIPPSENWCIGIGNPLVLRLPGGEKISTRVAGYRKSGLRKGMLPLLLGPDVTKDKVPVGTELWVKVPADGDKGSMHEFSKNFTNLIAAARDYLSGKTTLAVLNGHVSIANDELRLADRVSDKHHPVFQEILDEWATMINRRWNEWGLEKEPVNRRGVLRLAKVAT